MRLPHPPCQERLRHFGDEMLGNPYHLSHESVMRFWEEGVLGPLCCDAPELETLLSDVRLNTPATEVSAPRNVYDPQLGMEVINQLAKHPSIVHRIAQLLGTPELSFFQARLRIKAPGWHDLQPWHQDVGKNHGGLRSDGVPIPSLTVWLSLDGADENSGGVVLLPRTHRSLIGDWRKGFHGLQGLQNKLDTSEARPLATQVNHFYIFHSWAVHCSLTNQSQRKRTALIMRYMDRKDAIDAAFPHTPCDIW
jgi:hypothetical protein